ncbi:PREDICTED: lysM domain-containing GPI-anchored protein 2 [Theobroma cacao]|uniref:LysM domain-containing GPI-anchored protein 2 n=1 Tax=Theobroma cacao TaxID=3641 RepID=A0AB32VZK9_THECC|nr:PREDICTED: lysM domain-containing GPI-anchored protein 2 [Theobroma cacao]
MGFAFAKLFLLLLPLLSSLTLEHSAAQGFNCSSPRSCRALVGYVTVNNTDLGTIQSLFNVKNFRSILGANGLSLSTPRTHNISAQQVIKIPINCVCYNDTGTSSGAPIYEVKEGDFLFHIAAEIFSRLVTFQQITEANGIGNSSLIMPGQKLKIPLPCSCDDVNGEKVVHYAHIVKLGSTLEGIASEFGTDEGTLRRVNNITADNQLIADQPIDVPLKACNSPIRSDSLDFPLLAANGTYVFTANGCVRCTCDAAVNNSTLRCEPSQNKPSRWETCPSMQCEASDGLSLGNSTTSGCNRTTCSYAGYNNSTIFTTLEQDSTCSSTTPSNDVTRISLNWDFLCILILLCFHLFQ